MPGPSVSSPPGVPPASPARAEDAARVRRLRFLDALIGKGITGGGLLIIAAVLGIFVFVFAEALPLLLPGKAGVRSPGAESAGAGAGRPLAVGEDEYREAGWVLSDLGRIRLLDFRAAAVAAEVPLEGLGTAKVLSGARALDHDVLAAGLSDGRVLAAGIAFEPVFADGRRTGQTVRVEWQFEIPLREDGGPVSLVGVSLREDRVTIAGAGPGFLGAASRKVEGARVRRMAAPADAAAGRTITALALDQDAGALCVGTSDGRILRFAVEEDSLVPRESLVAGSRGVTALAWAFGSQTLLVGDEAGTVSGWQSIREPGAPGRELRRVRAFAPVPAAVTAFAPSRRNKCFLVVDRAGGVRLDHATTERTLASFELPGGGPAAVSPKFDGGAVGIEGEGLRRLDIDAPHPEVSLGALFAPLLYEGYDRPEFVWQSTGGTDDFEPKLSLVPLLVGSLKGVLYALLFSVPLALLGALYTSQFAPPFVRSVVKPTVEVMAALPSVVVGILAGLWLSPFVERHLAEVVVLAVAIPASILAAVGALRVLPPGVALRVSAGREMAFLAPFLAAGAVAAFLGAGTVERAIFGGNLRQWLTDVHGIRYDPRNAVVVGFALGFAVIPILYTVAEDAMSNVPRSLRAASEALGASRWQTAWRLVVPASSPGIFAAIMLGFGRAIGETMIVVMATGNTPVLDLSPFNGMRTISACIAVEMPEAPAGGTLYRVLFLAGALLFAFAFLCNTAADLVGTRLRSRYGKW
jgi:phosphate transport system permease protein